MSVRCFLHFRHGRHDNTLTWEAQDEAAARKIGASDTRDRERGRLDARLLWPRAQRAPRLQSVAGGNSGGLVVVVPAIPGLAVAGYERRFFGGGWTDFSEATAAARRAAARSGNAVAAFSFHGGTRTETEHHHRIQSRAGVAGAGGHASAGRASCGYTCRKRWCSRMRPTLCAP